MLSLRALAHWLGLSRSWYSARRSAQATREESRHETAGRDGAKATALRDAIERIVLDLPG